MLSAEVFACHAGRKEQAERVSSMAWLCAIEREKSIGNFWDGQRQVLSGAQAWQSHSFVQVWNVGSEIGRRWRRNSGQAG